MGREGKGPMGEGFGHEGTPEGGKPACTVPVLVWILSSGGRSILNDQKMMSGLDAYARLSGGACPQARIMSNDSVLARKYGLPEGSMTPTVCAFLPDRLGSGTYYRIIHALVETSPDGACPGYGVYLFLFSPDFKTYEVVEIPKDDPGSPA